MPISLLDGYLGDGDINDVLTGIKNDLRRLRLQSGSGIIVNRTASGQRVSLRAVAGGTGGGGEAEAVESSGAQVYAVQVTEIVGNSVKAVMLSNPGGASFLVTPLAHQNSNLRVGSTILASAQVIETL